MKLDQLLKTSTLGLLIILFSENVLAAKKMFKHWGAVDLGSGVYMIASNPSPSPEKGRVFLQCAPDLNEIVFGFETGKDVFAPPGSELNVTAKINKNKPIPDMLASLYPDSFKLGHLNDIPESVSDSELDDLVKNSKRLMDKYSYGSDNPNPRLFKAAQEKVLQAMSMKHMKSRKQDMLDQMKKGSYISLQIEEPTLPRSTKIIVSLLGFTDAYTYLQKKCSR